MAISNFAVFVRELFAPWADVVVRPMFGGAGVYRDGLMFALLSDDRIFLKISAETKPQFEAVGSTPFVFQPKSGPAMAMSYYLLVDAAYDDPDALKHWADLAWTAAVAGKAKKSTKKTPRAKTLRTKDLRDLPLKTKVKARKAPQTRTR